jgi:hypothetical protein
MHLLKIQCLYFMVSHRSVIAEARFQTQAMPCEICRGQIGPGDRFFVQQLHSFIYCPYYSTIAQCPFIHSSITDAVLSQKLTASLNKLTLPLH